MVPEARELMPNRTNDLSADTPAVKLPVWKKLLFALLVGGLFFGVIEGVLWLFGAETMLQKEDPFRGFSKLVKVFEVDGDQYRTRHDSSHRTFNDQAFAVQNRTMVFAFSRLVDRVPTVILAAQRSPSRRFFPNCLPKVIRG